MRAAARVKESTDKDMQDNKLKRVLSGFDTVMLGFGAMIGWGWIILAGGWLGDAGYIGAAIAFIIGAVAIIVVGINYAELASALPYAGGEHVYTERAFGSGISFVCTWAILFGYVSVVAFEAIALPVAITYIAPDFKFAPLWDVAGYTVHGSEVMIGVVASFLIAGLNILGIRIAARVQTAVIVLLLGAGAVLLSGGLLHLDQVPSDLPSWKGFGGVFAVLITVPFLFVGFDVIPQSAEEISGSMRGIGTGLIVSIAMAALFYLLIAYAVGLAPLDPDTATLATADAAGAWWGSQRASAFVILAGIGGILTSWNAFLIGGSRAIYAMARSGQLPAPLKAVHSKFGTPWAAILLISALSAIAPLFGRSALGWVVNAGGFGIVFAYLFVAAAFIKLRLTEPALERPYRAPGGIIAGWVALILGAGMIMLYLPFSPSALIWPQEWGMLLAWALLGFGFWMVRPKKRA